MTDRQLLERAALAYGRKFYFDPSTAQGFLSDAVAGDLLLTPWNPLDKDEDSMEMRVRFNLRVSVHEGAGGSGHVDVGTDSSAEFVSEVFSDGQQSASIRRAVVRMVAQRIPPA